MFSRFFLAGMLTLTPFLVLADEPAAGRYQLQPVEGGVVRLDTTTGEMTLCRPQGSSLACAGADAVGDKSEIAALKARIAALEARLAAAPPAQSLPSDEEVDRGLSIMEKFMRRFMGLAEEMDRRNPSSQALPQKT